MRLAIVAAGLVFLSGCGWFDFFGKSDEHRRLETGSSAPVEIPPGMDRPDFQDAMPIPEVVDYRGIAGQDVELRLPEPLSTTFGVDQIVIRRLGEQRWVFLDLPTATIWPQVLLYWEENHLPLSMEDPRNGVMETEWLVGTGGEADAIYDSLLKGSDWSDPGATKEYKFRLRLEPGVRSGSSELYVEQAERSISGVTRMAEPVWDGSSENPELEGKVLSALAYYLGERTAQGPSISLLAAGLQESKATLEAGPDGMVLRYKLDFNRAWATVGAALEDASVSVEDLDRTAAVYYVYYTSRHQPNPGFFRRLFGGDDDEARERDTNPGHRFRVQLESQGSDILVTVGVDAEIALADTESLILKERLLKLIKEYST